MPEKQCSHNHPAVDSGKNQHGSKCCAVLCGPHHGWITLVYEGSQAQPALEAARTIITSLYSHMEINTFSRES
ncbi:hypothetical protein ACRRTK_008825 [Alexandromys fortis]